MTFHVKDDMFRIWYVGTRTEQSISGSVVWFRHHFALSRVNVATVGVLHVRVRMVFCYNTIERSPIRRCGISLHYSENEIARVRADVENAIPRQSHDVASAPASRRRVERDASSNASRGVRAARSYRERGLLFFVLDACGQVRRRAAKRARYPKVRCLFVISVAHARFFRSGGGRKRARAERAKREARRKTRDRWPNARHHLVREKQRWDRLRSRHAPAAEATSRMGDVPVLLVYANPKAKPPPRHALASALWFRTSRLPTVISGRVGSKRRACRCPRARTNARDVDAACRR